MSPSTKPLYDPNQTTAPVTGGGFVVSTLGKGAACLIVLMVVAQFAIVVLRSLFGLNFIWAQEFVLGLHGVSFLLVAPWTLLLMRHVRIDVLSERFSKRGQNRLNRLGFLFLLFPMMGAIFASSLGYVFQSWSVLEGSVDISGLPGKFLLKTAIPVFAILMFIAGLCAVRWQTKTLEDNS